ncbi:hypothetical protein NXF25_000577 [Crotalus adamanteus]|uniref:Uncharacterized protein n=1 Tax=Crotalus adamanteus TaxID=8729 RepID=A0AAW1C4R2_CROAD
MLANISKLWAMYKPSKEIQPIVFSAILTGYLYYKIEFGGKFYMLVFLEFSYICNFGFIY